MADAQVESMALRPTFKAPSISTTHRDITDERYRDLRRPRRVRFYANGDRFFKGKKLHVTPHRYVTFNDLLNDLTEKLPANIQLTYGVRQVFTPVGGHRVRDIEDLQDGGIYVCGGFEAFKPIKYGKQELEPWSVGKQNNYGLFGEFPGDGKEGANNALGRAGLPGVFHPGRTLRQTYPTRRPYGTFGARGGAGSYWGGAGAGNDAGASQMKPKVITVMRNGPAQPHANVKILLNRRSVQSYEQMMKDISEAFGPKWRNNKVRKLFTIRGKEVQGISDFFRDDDIFIGVGSESLRTGQVQDILDELYPDSPYAKSLMREWDKTKKRYQQTNYRYHIKEEPGKNDESTDDRKKIDSGLGSDASKDEAAANERDDVIYRGKHPEHSKAKRSRKQPPAEPDLLVRIEKERGRAADDERERARKRMQKRLDTERRLLDEERRRRGLMPLKPINDPYRSDSESPRRHKPHDNRNTDHSESPSHVSPRREAGEEKRAKPHSDQARYDDDEPRIIVVVKGQEEAKGDKGRGHRSNRSDTEDDGEKHSKDHAGKDNVNSPRFVENNKADDRNKDQEPDGNRDVEMEKDEQKAKTKHPKHDGHNMDENANKVKEKAKEEDKESQDRNKENQEPRENKRRKSKSKTVIHKTRLERQISNADYVLDKYEPGKVLGDGNFAVVKQCRLKSTNSEFAMKVIDKSKLKGKEHMIENEIEIMKLCNHPNIVKLFEEYETNSEIYLIMELVKGGDLFDAITQSVKFNEPQSASMASDLTLALFYLHSRGIVHRDLKPENLLVCRNRDGSITLKLADFGLAMEVKEQITTVCGTPTYVAPEILAEIGYGLEVDMWAVGVITYILLCGFPPFRSPDRKQTELFEFIKAGEYEFLAPYWDNTSKAAKDLISRLLIVEKKKRYTAVDVLCHPWIITLAGTLRLRDSLDEHRKNLRRDLELQARQNRDSYKSLAKQS